MSIRRSNWLRNILFFVNLFLIQSIAGYSQSDTLSNSKRKTQYVFLPATAYSPETSFTLGFLSAIFFDTCKGDTLTQLSQIALLGVVTAKKQLSTGIDYTIFTPNERFRFEGRVEFKKDIDRNYGVGNNPEQRVAEWGEGTTDIINRYNYLDTRMNRFELRLAVYRKLRENFYAGLTNDLVWVYNYEGFENRLVETSPSTIESVPVNARTSGFGVGLIYDTRDNLNNAYSGTYIQVKNQFYHKGFGSDYNYYGLLLDVRKYGKVIEKHTFAARFISDQRYHQYDNLPLYSLTRVGGKQFARGYYEGIYRDNLLLGAELEYRIPLWQNPDAKFWQFWQRLGVHFFASATQVQADWESFEADAFRIAVGMGGRYVLNFQQRLNLRLDIGYGLHDAAELDGNSIGFYFFISEAF